jgi:hypothetical protein
MSVNIWRINNGFSNGVLSFTEYRNILPSAPPWDAYATVHPGDDWNGDGLTDVLASLPNARGNYVYLNNGAADGLGFTRYDNPMAGGNLGDWNGDGLTDVMIYGAPQNAMSVNIWRINNGFSNGVLSFTEYRNILPSAPPWDAYATVRPGGDWNGDGLTDVLASLPNARGTYVYLNNGTSPDLLTSVRGGLGATVSFTHQPLTAAGVYTKDTGGNAAVAPARDVVGPLWVVTRLDQSDGIGGTRSWGYSYAGAKVHGHGRGFLGFRQTTVTDLQKSIVATANYRQDYPFEGLIANETTTAGQLTLKAVTNSYGSAALGGTRQRVFLSGSTVARADLNGAALPSVTTAYQYDGFNNATQVTTTASDGFSKTVTNSYQNDTGNWLLGRLLTGTATNQTPQ